MFVCICMGITDKDISEAVKNGAKTVSDITMITGAGSGCGSCAAETMKILEKSVSASGPVISLPTLSGAPARKFTR